MYSLIYGSLDRQARGLALLGRLLQEEFDFLCNRQTEEIINIEFSIHELLRQLADEKDFVKKTLGGGRLKDYMSMLEEEQNTGLDYLVNIIDNFEQKCSRQATDNCELSLALLDNSTDSLNFLQNMLVPKNTNTYGKNGVYEKVKVQATIISGRL